MNTPNQQLYANQNPNHQTSNTWGGSFPTTTSINIGMQPQEPCLQAKADELLKFVSELESHLAAIDGLLFAKGGSGELKGEIPPSSVASKVSGACHRVACLCGQAATIIRELNGNN